MLWSEEQISIHPFQPARRISDKFAWTIPFDTHKVRCPSTPDSVLEYSSFSIKDIPNSRLSPYYEISATLFRAGPLLYKYFYPSASRPNFWLDFVGERMEHLTYIEVCKIKPEDRPTHIRHYRSLSDVGPFSVAPTVKLPDTWTFYDDEIPKWHKAWEQSLLKKTDDQTADEPLLLGE